MTFNKISSTPYFNVAGIVVVGGLTLGTIVPTNTWVNELLNNHALLVMLFFLASGFIGFVLRNNAIILFNFMACIVLCSFLKEQQPSDRHALLEMPVVEEATVRIANLTLDKNSDLMVLQQHLEQANIDFLSLQIAPTVDLPTATLDQLKARLPYYRIIDTENDARTLVFSSYEMESLDTFHYRGNQSISFVGTLSMNQEKAVPFISTNIPAADYKRPEAQQHWVQLSQFMTRRYEEPSTTTSKNVHLTAWQPAVNALCYAKGFSALSEYSPKFPQAERLFYAENLVCKEVEDLLGGCGAVATYQIIDKTNPNYIGRVRGASL